MTTITIKTNEHLNLTNVSISLLLSGGLITDCMWPVARPVSALLAK